MRLRASSIVAIVAVAILILIVATMRVFDKGSNNSEDSLASGNDAESGSDLHGLQQVTSESDRPTPNTQEAEYDGSAATVTSPTLKSLHWPASEYEAVFGLHEPSSTLQKVHANFINESRNASWADAMEAGIAQALVHSDATAEITVAYVECRSTICEVAGSMPERPPHLEPDPYSLFPEDLGEGWWQGEIDMGLGTHTYEAEGVTRFIVIIAEPTTFLAASEGH